MAHQCAAISGADTNTKAVVEFCSTTADLSVPNLRSKGARASPSLLAHAAGRGWGPAKNAPRGFLPSHGLPPTMAAFQRKAAQLQIQLRGKPRIPTGFLLIPPPRSAATKGMMIRRISFTMSKIPQHRTIVNCFLCILAAS